MCVCVCVCVCVDAQAEEHFHKETERRPSGVQDGHYVTKLTYVVNLWQCFSTFFCWNGPFGAF